MSQDPKRKRDIIDPELAKRMAWRALPPEGMDEPKVTAAPPPPDPEAAKAFVEAMENGCHALAEDVRAAWAMSSSSHRVIATRNLLRRAQRLGLGLVRMEDHPLEAIRLFRLVARHAAVLPIRSTTGFALSWMRLSARHPELEDLIVEVARSNDRHLNFALDRVLDREDLEGKLPRLGARLAKIVDDEKSWDVRATALRWLSIDDFPDAIPTLRRALRSPHVQMRHYALHILLEMKGDPIRDEDVEWLLEDALAHPIGRDGGLRERTMYYENKLVELLRKKAPPKGCEILETIADGGGAHIDRDREGLGSGWALQALAAGYPERALDRIDHNLVSPDGFDIYRTIDAVGHLPEEMARPRLLRATGLCNALAVDVARRAWQRRFPDACPVDPWILVPKELLLGPPSERMEARLLVLQGKVEKAARAMVDVLLDEAPPGDEPPPSLDAGQREALALLLHALRNRSVAFGKSLQEWGKLLYQRFGAPAFDTMAQFAEEGVRVGVRFGWASALLGVARAFRLSEAQIERLRGIVRIALATPRPGSWYAASSLVGTVGVSADIADRLLDLLVAAGKDTFSFSTAYSTTDALAKLEGPQELDARIAREIEKAWREERWEPCEHLARLAAMKNVPAAIEVTRRMLDAYDGDRDASNAMSRAFHSLRAAKLVTDDEVVRLLEQPEHPLFAMAAAQVHQKSADEMARHLFRALESKARSGASAALAARALVNSGRMSPEDERLDALLSAAPDDARAELCDVLLFDKVPLEKVRHHVEACLLSKDERTSLQIVDVLHMRRPDGTDELFEKVLPSVHVARTRELLLSLVNLPNEAALYWQDADEEEEEVLSDEGDIDEDDDEIPQGDA